MKRAWCLRPSIDNRILQYREPLRTKKARSYTPRRAAVPPLAPKRGCFVNHVKKTYDFYYFAARFVQKYAMRMAKSVQAQATSSITHTCITSNEAMTTHEPIVPTQYFLIPGIEDARRVMKSGHANFQNRLAQKVLLSYILLRLLNIAIHMSTH
jgi:hypothetical protein